MPSHAVPVALVRSGAAGFELRLDQGTDPRGEELAAGQRNATDEERQSGNETTIDYRACQPIVPGNDRFGYWGITPAMEHEADFEMDSALGVPFAVTGD